MENDRVDEIFNKALMKEINKRLEQATTQEAADAIIEDISDDDLLSMYRTVYKERAKESVDFFRNTMHEEVKKFREEENAYIYQLNEQWKDGFVASEAIYILVSQEVETYVSWVKNLKQDMRNEQQYVFTSLQHLQGRALQIYLEIITLMKNGFVDGAYARWRSMYELVIIASFILKYGEDVAEQFIKSLNNQGWYEWARASGIFPKEKKKIQFNDIKKNCDINTEAWSRQYNLSNVAIHASSRGTFGRLGKDETTKAILIGRSNYGLHIPAEYSAISLAHITSMFLAIHLSGERAVIIEYITNWIDTIREIYFKIHDKWFPDDEPLWNDSIKKDNS